MEQPNYFAFDQYTFNHNLFLKNLDFEPFQQDCIDYLSNETDTDYNQATPQIDSGVIKASKKITKKSKKEASPSENTKTRAVRNLWKAHEDELLLKLYAEHGPKWTLIGRLIGDRTCKQVRDRYINNLRPNIKNEPFSQEEDEQLIALYYQFGTKWKQIAGQMAGRTQAQVKNRFYLHLKDSLANFKINPFAVAKKDSACSASTVDTEYVNENFTKEDTGFGFISYQQEQNNGIFQEDDEEEFDCQLNLFRDSSYKFESLL